MVVGATSVRAANAALAGRFSWIDLGSALDFLRSTQGDAHTLSHAPYFGQMEMFPLVSMLTALAANVAEIQKLS